MTDDAQLLRRYDEEGSEPAFAEFVSRSLPLVYSAALRRMNCDTHRAREVAQQVFISAARSAHSLSRHDQLTAWLYTTTRNAALNLMRTERRRAIWERAASEKDPTSAESDWTAIAPLLDTAMDELGTRDREALLLRFFAGLSFAELGARCGLGENAARMRVQRALEKLRDRLARRGVTSSAAALAIACMQHAAAAPMPVGMATAIAGESLVAASSPSFFGAMTWFKSSSLAVGGALGLATLAVVSATYQLSELRAVEREFATVQAENWLIAAEVQKRGQPEKIATNVVESRKPEPLLTSLPAAPVPSAPNEEMAHVVAGREFLARHPAVGEAVADWFRAQARFNYTELYRDLGLTPQQSEALGEILRSSIFFGSWGPRGQYLELHVGEQRTPEEREARIAELIGEEGLKRYRRSHREVAGRQLSAQVGSILFFSDTPLTATQSSQLARVVAATRDGQGNAYWHAIVQRAGEFMSPAQVEAVRRLGMRTMMEEAASR